MSLLPIDFKTWRYLPLARPIFLSFSFRTFYRTPVSHFQILEIHCTRVGYNRLRTHSISPNPSLDPYDNGPSTRSDPAMGVVSDCGGDPLI